MKRGKRDNLAAIVLAILLAYLIYEVVQNQLHSIYTDYNGHTYVYLPLFTGENWWKGWMAVPYCVWHLGVLGMHHILHIPLNVSAAYVSIFFSMLCYFIVYWMLIKYTSSLGKEISTTKAAFLSFAFSLSQGLYFEWLDAGERSLGIFSMNPLHNPTQMAVNPFSLICFCLVYDIWNKQDDEEYKGTFFDTQKGLKKPFIYLAIFLLLSAMTKPTFAEMFIPAVAIVMLIKWIGKIAKKDGSGTIYFKKCLQMLYCAIPALIFILIAFMAYFLFGGSYGADGSFMITKWMEVWSMFTDNVVLSIALGMAFPLFLIMIDAKFFWKDNMGKLALSGYIIGFLEAALLGEGGSKLSHGDFLWPMMSGMLLMWMASTLHLLKLEKEHGDSKIKCVLIDVAWVIFCLHVLCGLLYIKDLSGGI